ncbi:hypothetical protein HGP17_10720 [Rhizobium sp. P38BS-XIX]|uniref:hypothetical protein n=1 Tax=Rhizobium sp. P38BS-XIX TaxID=2726740 RepID=UPI001456AA42|nr:hypothetical protein [Rhizobium sp. P38BS-XIX]NLR97302.1 hypothetical protein [Rhizobium sp. P38BS-XIX]
MGYRRAGEALPGGAARPQTKPFIIEGKPSGEPKLDTAKPSIWGRFDDDIAQAMENQRDKDHAAATGGDDHA